MGRQIQNAGTGIANVGKGLTTAVTLPIAGIAGAAIKTAADYESAMSNVKAITGATGNDFKKLEQLGKDLGASTAWSAKEVAGAMQYTGMAGWTAKENVEGLKGILDLSSASGTDLARTSDIMTDAISAFGDTAADSAKYADVMTKACTSANVSVDTLGESYKYCGAISGTMGYSIEEMTTSLAAMGNMGIKGSQAGTTLKNAISNMAAPTKAMKGAMDDLGISITNQDGSMKSWDSVIGNLKKSFGGLTQDQQAAYAKTLFGKESMAGMLAIINTSTEDYNVLGDAIKNSGGAAEEAANTQLNNLNGQLTLLKSALEGAAITIGDKLTPYLKQGVGWVQKATDWFNSLSDAQINSIMKFAGIAAAIGPAILVFGKIVKGVGGAVSMFSKITKVVANFGGIMGVITSPAGIVIGILAAIVVAGVLVYKNWDKVKAMAVKLGQTIKRVFLKSGIDVNKLKDTFLNMKANVQSAIENLKPVISKIIEFLKPVIKFMKDVFMAGVKITFSKIIGFISGFVDGATTYIDGIITAFKGVTQFLNGVFTGDWKKAFNGLKTFFKGWGEAVLGLLKMPINGFVGLVNGAIEAINNINIKIPDFVPGIGGKEFGGFNIPKLPMLYRGTNNWGGGPAMIHDRGAEIVDLPRGSRVYPHDKSIEMAKQEGAARGGFNITISKLADKIEVRSDEDIDRIAEALALKLKKVVFNV